MTPLDWMTDANLCGRTFAGPTFTAARAAVAAIFGLPMTEELFAIYRDCTRRSAAPVAPFGRAMVAAGRGAGKTLLAAFVVVYLACARDFRALLGPGELATVMLLCPDRRQARVAFRYVRGLLAQSPMLARLIVGETKESITLSTGAVIEIHTSSYRSTRGYSLAGAVIDECAFLPAEDAANPDVELVRALTPGLARVPGSLLLAISSPYAKRGVLWEAFRRHHGVDGAPVLTWQAPTRRMNPTIGQAVVDEALEDDAAAARSEWLAEFRQDIASYIDTETLRAVVVPGREALPRPPGVQEQAFTDVAGGGGRDSWATAWGYVHQGRAIVSGLLEFSPPFSPEASAKALADTLKARGIRAVTGDRFGGLWPVEMLRRHGVTYIEAEQPRSQLYLEALPIITAQRCELLDHPKMLRQFTQLERRTGRSGRDAVDHPSRGGGVRGHHDDLANAVAGLLVELTSRRSGHGGDPVRVLGL